MHISLIITDSLKHIRAIATNIHSIHQSCKDEEDEVTREPLPFSCKQRTNQIALEPYQGQCKYPQGLETDLNGHWLTNDLLITSTRLLIHVLLKSRLTTKHQRCQAIHDQVDVQQMSNFQRLLNSKQRTDHCNQGCCKVDCQLHLAELQNVMINCSTEPDCIFNAVKVIIKDNKVSCFLSNCCTTSHCKAYISCLKSWTIVYQILSLYRRFYLSYNDFIKLDLLKLKFM